MWKRVWIKRFRNFREFVLENLGRVNLIAGPNNVGKTNLLEALFLHAGSGNAALAVHISGFRGLLPSPAQIELDPRRLTHELLGTLFYRADLTEPFEIGAEDSTVGITITRFRASREPEVVTFPRYFPGPQLGVQAPAYMVELGILEYEEPGKDRNEYRLLLIPETQGSFGIRVEPPSVRPIPGVFVSAYTRSPIDDARRLGGLIQEGRHNEVVEPLKALEPRLQNLMVLPYLGVPYIYADLGDRPLLPLPVAGEGMERLVRILLAVASSRKGVVLVDEVENGFHFSILKRVWHAIIETVMRYDVQLFLTTHDWETVVAAHTAFREAGHYGEFRYVRLERGEDGEVRAIPYTETALETAIQESLEVR